MLWFLLALLLLQALMLPVTLQLDAAFGHARWYRITARYMMLTRHWPKARKPGSGPKADKPKHSHSPLPMLWDAAFRRLLTRHVHLLRLDGLLLLHTGDAAAAALLAGGLDAIGHLPPLTQRRVHVRVLPDFFRGRSSGQVQCIIQVKLGILIYIMLAALRWQHQEVNTWNIPSAN